MKEPKTKIGKWFDNFWYHYKWETIIILFVLIVLAVVIPQSLTRTKYDTSVLFCGPEFVDADENAAIESAFRQIMQDYDNDGKKELQLINITAFTTEQANELVKTGSYTMSVLSPYLQSNVSDSFSTQIFAGEASVCLLDPYWYSVVREEDGFVPLSEILGYTPEKAIDEYSIYLKDTDFGSFFTAFDCLPDDTVLCMRRMSTASAFLGQKRTEEKYEINKKLLIDIFNFKTPEQ